MKHTNYTIAGAAFLGLSLACATFAVADNEVKETTTTVTTAGTFTEFEPDTIVLKSEASPDPVRYSYTKTTTYVDEAGQPVAIETVKSGAPLTVYYIKVGDKMVASKVVVRKMPVKVAPVIEEKKTTTTTTTTDKK